MKREIVRKFKKSILISGIVTVLLIALFAWMGLFYLFSNPTLLKDIAKVLSDGTSNPFEITWGVFWMVLPIIILIQFGCSSISLAILEDKDRKDIKEKFRRKKK